MPDTTPNHAHRSGQQRPEDHADHAGKAHSEGDGRPVRRFRMSRVDRVGDMIVSMLARAGIGPFHLLITRGRKTGRLHTNPVVLVEQDGRPWLVAPYREVGPDEAGPILKRYIAIASATRPYFRANNNSPVEDFIAEAHRHPVFQLTPLSKDAQ